MGQLGQRRSACRGQHVRCCCMRHTLFLQVGLQHQQGVGSLCNVGVQLGDLPWGLIVCSDDIRVQGLQQSSRGGAAAGAAEMQPQDSTQRQQVPSVTTQSNASASIRGLQFPVSSDACQKCGKASTAECSLA